MSNGKENTHRSFFDSNGVDIFKKVMFVTISLTLAFIWGNSVLVPVQSSHLSTEFASTLQKVLPSGAYLDLIIRNIRKIAHFTEYGVLGIELSLYTFVVAREKSLKLSPFLILCGFTVALLDEGIQYFVGRGNSMKDVGIDTAGFSFYMVLAFAVLNIIYTIVSVRRKKIV